MKRQGIPKDLERRILTEAGHRCAIPTCRFPLTEKAHIINFSKVKQHTYENLIALCPNCHARFDRNEIDEKSMRIYKRKIAFLSDKYMKYELIVLEELKKKPAVIITGGELSIKNLIDDEFVSRGDVIIQTNLQTKSGETIIWSEVVPLTFIISLTEKGKRFINSWVKTDEELVLF